MKALQYVWSLPMGALGIVAAILASIAFREPIRWRDGALIVNATGPIGRRLAARGWGGFTLGWTIFLWRHDNPAVEAHERVHVAQVKRWGLLFWPAYLVCLAIYGYRRNPFEREAYGATGR